VRLLVAQNVPDSQARSFLGQLAKRYGDEKLAQAVALTSLQQPADCRSYIVKLCEGGDKPSRPISQAEINKAAPGKFVC
jgi:hypothetical protein